MSDRPPPPIDLQRLQRTRLPLLLILIVSSWIGVFILALLGLTLVLGFSGLLGSVLSGQLGIAGLVIAVLTGGATGIAAAGIGLMAGLVFVPVGATVAGYLHSRHAARYAGRLFMLSEPSPGDPLGARVLDLSRRLGMPQPPGAFWITGGVVNAFAMGYGPSESVVAIGEPLGQALSADELDAIIGHELGHVVYADVSRTMFLRAFQDWLGRALVFYKLQRLARWTLTMAGEATLMAHSRHREYWADAIGAALTSRQAMISALQKIHEPNYVLSEWERRYAHVMFRGTPSGWFSTHPSLDERVEALISGRYLDRIPRMPVSREGPPTSAKRPIRNYTDGI